MGDADSAVWLAPVVNSMSSKHKGVTVSRVVNSVDVMVEVVNCSELRKRRLTSRADGRSFIAGLR